VAGLGLRLCDVGDAAHLVLQFGEYRGATLFEVAQADPDYIRSLALTAQSPQVRAAALQLCASAASQRTARRSTPRSPRSSSARRGSVNLRNSMERTDTCVGRAVDDCRGTTRLAPRNRQFLACGGYASPGEADPTTLANAARTFADLASDVATAWDERWPRTGVSTLLMREMYHRCTSFWAWGRHEWLAIVMPDSPTFIRQHRRNDNHRLNLLALAYLLREFQELDAIGRYIPRALAYKVFGQPVVDDAVDRVCQELFRWGYGRSKGRRKIPHVVCAALLRNRSPIMEELSTCLAVRRPAL
jgi:hypothetical protein